MLFNGGICKSSTNMFILFHRSQISEKPKCFHLFSRLRMASLESVAENPYNQTSCYAMEVCHTCFLKTAFLKSLNICVYCQEVCLQAKLLCTPGENLGTCFLSLPRVPDPRRLEWSVRCLHVRNHSNM